MPKVVAIIPTYNRAHCIARAIESVLSQTYADIDVVVVDDGSTDDTARIVAGFGNSVRYLVQDNAGQGPARNKGVAESDSDWIAFLDSDDVWLPTKIERQLEFTQTCRVELSFTDFSLRHDLDGDGYDSWLKELNARGRQTAVRSGRIEHPMDFVLGPGDLAFTSTMMIARETFELSRGYRSQYRRCQDNDLYIRLAAQQKAAVAFLAEPLAQREIGGNATAKHTYEFRLSAFADAYKQAMVAGDEGIAQRLMVAILHDLRAFAGASYRERAILDMAAAVLRFGLLRMGSSLGLPRIFMDSSA